ncbi:MAG: apolipoprotein N-acyltransferase [Actinomycetes bacterium]
MSARWHPPALAVAAGLAVAAAHPPLGWWPLALLAPALLAIAVARAGGSPGPSGTVVRIRTALGLGTLAGLSAYGPMLLWVARPAGVVAWVLLALSQAVFLGAFAVAVAPSLRGRFAAPAVALAWTGAEAWRGAVPLGGFGWGELAYAHAGGTFMLPSARVVGARGLTLLTALVAGFVYDAWRRARAATDGLDGDTRDLAMAGFPHLQPALIGVAATLALSVLVTVEPPPEVGTLEVLAVQGNDMPDTVGTAVAESFTITTNLAEETARAVAADGVPGLTVWPESGVDRDPTTERGAELAAPLAAGAAVVGDAGFVIGVNLAGPEPRTFRNTAAVVDATGRIGATYDKRHLVPFGEFVPARPLLGDLPPLRLVPNDGVPGDGPQVLEVAGTRVAVAICFETLFGRLVRDNVLAGPGEEPAALLLASTNDASYGFSSEPAQHLAQSVLRAVETGRHVVHAALSGSSAFVAPDGTVTGETELFTVTHTRGTVGLVEGRTPFLVTGDWVGLLAQAVSLALLVLALVARARRPHPARPAA